MGACVGWLLAFEGRLRRIFYGVPTAFLKAMLAWAGLYGDGGGVLGGTSVRRHPSQVGLREACGSAFQILSEVGQGDLVDCRW